MLKDSKSNTDRFVRHTGLWLFLVVAVGFLVVVVATESWLVTRESANVFAVNESTPEYDRHIRLREWQPNTVFIAAPPAIGNNGPEDFSKELYRLETDQNGFIGPSGIHEKPALEIVFIGGSTTECMFVPAEKRFPYLVGRLLEGRLGMPVNSYNAGKSGNNLLHSTLILTAKILPLNPDIIVVMHNVNDLGVLTTHGTYWPESTDFGHIRRTPRDFEAGIRAFRDSLIPLTYRALRRLKNGFSFPFSSTVARAEGVSKKGKIDFDSLGYAYESALNQFVSSAGAWNVPVALMTQPLQKSPATEEDKVMEGNYLSTKNIARHGLTFASVSSAHEFFNAIVRHTAKALGSHLIELAGSQRYKREHFYDRLHFNETGSVFAAEKIAESLMPMAQAIMVRKQTKRVAPGS